MAEPRRWSLATQVAVVTTLVALVAVVLSFLVSASLVRSAAETQARHTLGHYADLVADSTAADPNGPLQRLRQAGPAVRALYRIASITPVLVRPDGLVVGAAGLDVPSGLVTAAAAGQSVDTTVSMGGRRWFAAARPLASGKGSVVLLQPRSSAGAITSPLRRRIIGALAIGLAVAVLAGLLVSRRLARPLVHAADAAGRLAHGERDVRLQSEGPAEVAAVSESINALAAALAASEGRQRNFLLSVSHELRTPLTSIGGYAEALADGVVAPDDVAAAGTTIRAESERMHRLVNDLLDLGRLGAVDFRIETSTVDIATLVRAAADAWRPRCAKAGVDLRVDLPPVPLTAITDAARVRQIIDALVDNALRVVPAGAPIVLAARPTPEGVDVEVRDGGPGLTDDDLLVAFERSALYDRYRGERRVGTGLGLALVGGLSERLGGQAHAGHAPEGGASFGVTLPA